MGQYVEIFAIYRRHRYYRAFSGPTTTRMAALASAVLADVVQPFLVWSSLRSVFSCVYPCTCRSTFGNLSFPRLSHDRNTSSQCPNVGGPMLRLVVTVAGVSISKQMTWTLRLTSEKLTQWHSAQILNVCVNFHENRTFLQPIIIIIIVVVVVVVVIARKLSQSNKH